MNWNGLRRIQASRTWDGEGRHGDGDGALHDREDEGLRGGGRGGEDHQAGDNQLNSDGLRSPKEVIFSVNENILILDKFVSPF